MLSRTLVNRRFVVVLAATLLALLAGIALANGGNGLVKRAHAQGPASTTVTYPATNALFANPERGFYHHTETHSNAYTPLNLLSLQNYRQNEDITLILRLFYLDDFVASPISQTYLDAMAADFATLRQAGLKAVVRIAYTNQLHFAPSTSWPPVPPYGDATKAQMLAHLAQLAPVLQANSDVIALAQAGFIGIWGEWYYTDYFVDDPNDPGTVSPAKHIERGEVLNAILNALPGRMVQVRTPLLKQKIYGTGTGAGNALPPANAFNGSGPARTGHHNDCFLASDSDFGTYSDIAQDKAYLGEETKYLPMGGETCNPNPPRSECPIALSEMALFHWSYLNTDYHPGVLGGWASGGCLDTVKQRLGYRLALVEGRYPNTVRLGGNLAVEIDLRNEGWAAPYNPRPVELVLRHQGTLAVHRFPLAVDPRFWLADGGGNHSIVQSIPIPANLPAGAYDLLLSLPDASPTLADRAEYAIRLANDSVWEASSGLNRLLHTVTISAAPINQPPVCTAASASPSALWPDNHKYVAVQVTGVTDPDGDPVTIAIDSIRQDEAVNASGSGNTSPDGAGVGTSTAQVRAERVGGGNGRVYTVGFSASDGSGGACSGAVTVGVPPNKKGTAVNDGASFDSTAP
jgi:hypothetical protein